MLMQLYNIHYFNCFALSVAIYLNDVAFINLMERLTLTVAINVVLTHIVAKTCCINICRCNRLLRYSQPLH